MKKERIRMIFALISFWCGAFSCGMICGISVGHTSILPILGWFFIGVSALMLANAFIDMNEKDGYVIRLVKK